MKVRALVSFVGYDGAGVKHRLSEGDEMELPAGVDWLVKGLVEEVKDEGGRTAERKPGEAEAKSKKKAGH